MTKWDIVKINEHRHQIVSAGVGVMNLLHDGSDEALKTVQTIVKLPDLIEACKVMLEAWDCRQPATGIVAIQKALAKAGVTNEHRTD